MSGRPEPLSIIVPVFNEAATSRAVVDRLLDVALPVSCEIRVVDDGSTDGIAGVVYGSRCLRGRGGAPLVTFAANRVPVGERLR